MRYSVVVSVKAFIDEMGKRNMGAYAGSIGVCQEKCVFNIL